MNNFNTNDNNIINIQKKNLLELENENNLLKNEILSYQDKLKSKDLINSEVQSLFKIMQEKFNQFTNKIDSLKKENELLLLKNKQYEEQLIKFNKQKADAASTLKSAKLSPNASSAISRIFPWSATSVRPVSAPEAIPTTSCPSKRAGTMTQVSKESYPVITA